MKSLNAKDFAMNKVKEIIEITYDLDRINNKEIIKDGIKRIQYLAERLPEHLEHLEVKEDKQITAYEEDCMKCETLDDLENKVQMDTIIAKINENEDVVKVIEQTAEKVANLKFKGVRKIMTNEEVKELADQFSLKEEKQTLDIIKENVEEYKNTIQKQQEEIETLEATLNGYKGLSNTLDLKQEEVEKLKLMLFMEVRNNKVLPRGLELNKTEKEISDKTKETIEKLEEMIDFKMARELYEL